MTTSENTEWFESVANCARRMCREMEDSYRSNYRSSEIHMPKIIGANLENESARLSVFLDGVIGTCVWIVSNGGDSIEKENEEFLIEVIKERFKEMRTAQTNKVKAMKETLI